MVWPIQKPLNGISVNKPKWRVWFSTFVVLFVFNGVSLYFIRKTDLHSVFYDKYLLMTVVIFVLFLSLWVLRFYKYGIDVSNYEMQEGEIAKIKNKWITWCSKHALVLGYEFFLPEAIEKEKIINNLSPALLKAQSVKFEKNATVKINESVVLRELMYSMQGSLLLLSNYVKFKIIFLKQPDLTTWCDFQKYWDEMLLPKESILGYEFFYGDYISGMSEWMDVNDNIVCILVNYHVSDDIFTEHAEIVLLASDKLRCKNIIPVHGIVYRPLLCDGSNFQYELKNMSIYQPITTQSQHVLFNGLSDERVIKVSQCIHEIRNSEDLSGLFNVVNLNLHIGNIDEGNTLLTLCFALAFAQKTKNVQLVSCNNDNSLIFNAVAASDRVSG